MGMVASTLASAAALAIALVSHASATPVARRRAQEAATPLPKCGPRGCWFYYVNEETQECGLTDARPRMPDVIANSPELMEEYIAATEQYYTVPVGGGVRQRVKLGNCAADTPYTVLQPALTRQVSWPLDTLPMLAYCAEACECNPGAQIPGLPLPPCTDDADAAKPICAVCGPAMNQPQTVNFFIKSRFPPPPPSGH